MGVISCYFRICYHTRTGLSPNYRGKIKDWKITNQAQRSVESFASYSELGTIKKNVDNIVKDIA